MKKTGILVWAMALLLSSNVQFVWGNEGGLTSGGLTSTDLGFFENAGMACVSTRAGGSQ